MSRRSPIDKKLAALAAAGIPRLEVTITVEALSGELAVRIACCGVPEADPAAGRRTFEEELARIHELVRAKLRAEAEKAREAAELAEARAERLAE